jgi:hypothetical protein
MLVNPPLISQQLWAIILPAANYVQNPMVSSWFHFFAWVHRFCFVKTVAARSHTSSCYSEK